MQVSVKSKGLASADSLREYVEGKVSRLDRYLPEVSVAEVDLEAQKTRNAEHSQVAQITLRSARGIVLRAEERSADMRASIDAAMDKMERQIRNYKGKHWQDRSRRGSEHAETQITEALAVEEDDATQGVVRVKSFQTRPMDVDEAIEQMELLGHDFFIFYNVNTNNFSVVYRRHDQGYGLLLPELI
ncbi:MAG: ribosome hibernation-promoting factor, HPF/YfiA family [Anaerolineae bacterium]|jgi:putative sigma-54 modulation protein|nr:ribosome-associated translation inhibitor RaiA [Chloroflexota bacterium]